MIQYVLFPNDAKSVKFLRSLESKAGFDDEFHVRESPIRNMGINSIQYKYFGDRLSVLLDFVQNKQAVSPIDDWFDRHKSDRTVLAVAILALFLSTLFGFLSMPILP